MLVADYSEWSDTVGYCDLYHYQCMLSLSQLLVLVAGSRPAGCETEEEDL